VAQQNTEDLVTMSDDQVPYRPTIPLTVPVRLFSWFRLCRGRELSRRVTPNAEG
jgi:hypothetical protein